MNNDSVLSRHFGITPQMIEHHRISIAALFVFIVVGFAMFVYGAATGATTDALFIVGLVMLLLGIIGAVVLLVYLKRKYRNGITLGQQHVDGGYENNIGDQVPLREEIQLLNNAQLFILDNYQEMFKTLDSNARFGLDLGTQNWPYRGISTIIPETVVLMNDKYRITIKKCPLNTRCDFQCTTITARLSDNKIGLTLFNTPKTFDFGNEWYEIFITEPYDRMLRDLLQDEDLDIERIRNICDCMKTMFELCIRNIHLHNLAVKVKDSKYQLYLVDVDPYEELVNDRRLRINQLIDEIRAVDNKHPLVDSDLIPSLIQIRGN